MTRVLRWVTITSVTDDESLAPRKFGASPSPIRRELLSLLVCPEDHAPLEGWDGLTAEGHLLCTGCGRAYPVREGVPNLLPEALRNADEAAKNLKDVSEAAEKRREMAARDAQVVDYDRMVGLKLFTHVEVPLTLRYLSVEPEHRMLEGGCGTGRMTAAFARVCRALLCVDFSAESIRVARTKMTPDIVDRVLFIQADLSRLPLSTEAFDRVGSFGVYEHIPTVEARDRALAEMSRVLKARIQGGRMAISAYRWGAPVTWMAEREGHHDGGIYFRRFTLAEFRDLLSPYLSVGDATEALLYYHLVWGRKHPPAA